MNVRVTLAFLLVCLPPAIACVTAQGLTKKAQSPAESGSDTEDSTLQDLPTWEHQFYRTIEIVEKASDKLATERQGIAASGDTSLIKSERLNRAKQAYSTAISGLPIRVHFRLTDVKPVKKLNRNRESIAIFLDDATIPYRCGSDAVIVYCSPTEARQLQIGAIIRADGTLATPERRAFAKLVFTDEEDSSFPFHISSVRVLDGEPLEEFRGFETRFLGRLPRLPSMPRNRAGSASFIP